MKSKSQILAAGLTLAILCSSASAESFFRPVLSFDSPVNHGFGSSGGAGFVAGAMRGAAQEHELSLEWHYNHWSYSAAYAGYAASGGETNMPCLFNYRYHLGGKTDKVRFYFGPALGRTSTKISITSTAPGSSGAVSNSDWAFTWSGSAGLLIKLTDQTALDIGYRYLQAQGRNFTVGTVDVREDDRKSHMVYAGLNLRF